MSSNGWNRSKGETSQAPAPVKPKWVRGVVAASVVVVGAMVAAWLLWPNGETRQKSASTKKALIKEVQPAKVAERAEQSAEKVEADLKPVKKPPQLETYRDTNGVLRYKGGLRVHEHIAKESIRIHADRKRIFEHYCENEIAMMLTIEPGDQILDDQRYDEKFEKDFMESLLEPIKIDEKDDPETKELKQAVIDTKKELVKRIKAGENLSDIMRQTREELVKLSNFRDNLYTELVDYRSDPSHTAQDIEDFTAAANKMLEERGAKKLSFPKLLRRKYELRDRQREEGLK